MNRVDLFKRIRRRARATSVAPSQEALLALLTEVVIEPFTRLGQVSALAILLTRSEAEEREDPPPNPCHAACAEVADSDYCQESWQLHLAELARRPETHWH